MVALDEDEEYGPPSKKAASRSLARKASAISALPECRALHAELLGPAVAHVRASLPAAHLDPFRVSCTGSSRKCARGASGTMGPMLGSKLPPHLAHVRASLPAARPDPFRVGCIAVDSARGGAVCASIACGVRLAACGQCWPRRSTHI